MKKSFILSVTLFTLVFTSCHYDELEFPLSNNNEMKTSKDGLNVVKDRVYSLDVAYQFDDVSLLNRHIKTMPSGDTLELICAYDMTGATIGFAGSWFIPSLTVRLFTTAVIAGVVSYAKYTDYYDNMTLSSMSNTVLSQVEDFRDLDMRQPINTLAPQQLYNSNIIGKNVGPIHNRVILAAYYTNQLDPNEMISDEDLFDAVSDEYTNPDHVLYETVADLLHDAHYVSDNELIESLNDKYSEELHLIHHVYEVALNLDSIALFDYTNQVMEIVHDAYVHELISDSSACLINASISTMAHTRLLWKSYLPDYRLTTMYFAYIADFDKWVLCNRSQLQELSNTYHVTCTGIPGIVRGKCTEIFFFPSSSTYYNVSNINYSQPIQNSYFQLSNNVSFERMIPVYSNRLFEHMESGYYHVRNVPNENGITYVSFLEP